MSYFYYYWWRKDLCYFINEIEAAEIWENFDKYKNLPFAYLINFSDCEGTIGTNYCKILAKSFNDYYDKIMSSDKLDEIFKEKYSNLKVIFNQAAENGCVVFS